MAFELPDLSYDYAALEPALSGQIMEIHHKKHHGAYVNNLKIALEKYKEAESRHDLAGMIAQQTAIRFNGGGHINHSIFWKNLAPVSAGGGQIIEGSLKTALQTQFGSCESFIEKLTQASLLIQGSGWGWLGYDKASSSLKIVTCANQDPLSTLGLVPILGIDVWEHAYYLQYQNVRADYLKNIWKVVNWKDLQERYTAVQ